MKILGLIAEYNPFHLGHKYHLEKAKQITGADYVIVVMSGNYVQRGTPAVTDKYSRAQMALNNGADLVFELPTCYATASANLFALGAISLLDKLSIVDYICFGSEHGDLAAFKELSSFMTENELEINELTYQYLKDGMNYPVAREKALSEYANTTHFDINNLEILKYPNNILGIEYLKSIKKLNSSLKPFTIKRNLSNYHDETLQSEFSSATSIRKAIEKSQSVSDLDSIKNTVPLDAFEILKESFLKTQPIIMDDFSPIIKYRTLLNSSSELEEYQDITKDLARRIKNETNLNQTIGDLAKSIKSKNNTLTRINRSFLHIILNITKKGFLQDMNEGYMPYARVIGMKKSSSHLLKEIINKSRTTVITKVSEGDKVLDSKGMLMFNHDLFASHLYNQIVYDKYQVSLPREYRKNLVIKS